MDQVYGAYNANATEKIHIKSYFDNFAALLTPNEYRNFNEIFFEPEQLEQLRRSCSIDHLTSDDSFQPTLSYSEKEAVERISQIPKDIELETLKKLKAKYGTDYKKRAGEYVKYQREMPVVYNAFAKIEREAIPGVDIFISIRVYQPFAWDKLKKQKIALSRVITMLGYQTLNQLRDKLYCISDLTGAYDVSDDPSVASNIPANRDIYKSSFFFIEDTFYNDMRHEDSKDNSAVIRTWGETRGLGPFYIEKMEDMRLDSLNIRFGYPWVYQHQGTCEHLIVFSDARLASVDDDLDVSHYPKIERIRQLRCSICMMCSSRPVHWLVKGSDRIPHDPCYFCEQCFRSFNYIKGTKVGTFKAFHYPYDPDIVKHCKDVIAASEKSK